MGICRSGDFTKGLRGKNADLDAACTNKCILSRGYANGMCPKSSDSADKSTNKNGTSDCPPECYRARADPVASFVGAGFQVGIMVSPPHTRGVVVCSFGPRTWARDPTLMRESTAHA